MRATEVEIRRYNSRLGLVLFSIYLAFYLGFVLINAFRPAWMELQAWAGVNLAIVYGFGLILAALLLALLYGYLCRTVDPASPTPDRGAES